MTRLCNKGPPPLETFPSGVAGWATEIWHHHGRPAAQAEGWDLFTRDDDELEIEAIAEPWEYPVLAARKVTMQLFADDNEVILHCITRTQAGSRLHLLALYLEGRHFDARTWVPNEMLPCASQTSVRHTTRRPRKRKNSHGS